MPGIILSTHVPVLYAEEQRPSHNLHSWDNSLLRGLFQALYLRMLELLYAGPISLKLDRATIFLY